MSQRWDPHRVSESPYRIETAQDRPRRNALLVVWNSPQLLPAGGVAVIVLTALLLIVVMTLRPWARPDARANTHNNIGDLSADYDRTRLAFLGEESGAPEPWKPPAGPAEDSDGLVAFVGYGCASCHGIDGKGTPAGPPVAGNEIRRIETLTRKGPKGMPAYDEFHLAAPRLSAVAGYVAALAEAPAPTPTTAPVATPYPTSTPPPTATPTPTATPLPPDAPTPTPTATPTPTPTPDPVRLKESQDVYMLVGCDLCHGANAEGVEDGPGLAGLTADEIRSFIREPVRPSDSQYSEEMDPYTEADLSDDELEAIIYFLLNLPN